MIAISTLGYLFLGLLASIALVFISIVSYKLIRLISNINKLIEKNESNITSTLNNLPQTSENIKDISDNVKDISDVAVETTASAIVAKENIDTYLSTFKDIVSIISNIFLKNK